MSSYGMFALIIGRQKALKGSKWYGLPNAAICSIPPRRDAKGMVGMAWQVLAGLRAI